MNYIKKTFITFLILVTCFTFVAVPVSAKTKIPRNGKYIDAQGHIYIMRHGKSRTGWFTYHGKRYYGHKTSSLSYPKGSVTTDAIRIKNNKMYYFGHDGKKQTRSSRYITLNRHNTSIKYLTAGRMTRYNANKRTYQWLNPNSGRWEDTGMLCLPYGSIDFQK